jgi:hypothetical protein
MEQQQQDGSQDTETIRSQWTPEQRVNAGQMAAQALNSPIFSVVHDLLSQKYYRSWLMSEAKEMKTRESNWYRQVALTDLMKEMVSMVSEAQVIVQERQRQNDPAEQERARMDEQGYGLDFNQKETS